MVAPRPPRPDAPALEVARIAARRAGLGRRSPRPPRPAWPARNWPPRGSTSWSATCPRPAGPGSRSWGRRPGPPRTRRGDPFVGKSGALLDQLLAEAGLSRAEAAVLNVVKCRPPGNRTPRAPEVARCSGWLRRQLDLLDPPVVVALGLSAAKWFLGPRTVLAQVRGRPHPLGGRAVWATYHPSAAIRFGPNGAPRRGPARRSHRRRRDVVVNREHVLPRPPRTPTPSVSRSPGCSGPATSSCSSVRSARARPL